MIRVTAAIVALCAIAATALWVEHKRLQYQLRQQRDEAVRAVEKGRYVQARPVLRRYIQRTGMDDVEAMVSLARAITAIPTPTRAERVQAMRFLNHAAAHEPERLQTHLALLALQAELGFDEALLRTAERIFALSTDDVVKRKAQRRKAEALLRLERFEAALATAESLLQASPRSIEAHRLMLEVLVRGPWPAQRLIDHARALRAFDADDVRHHVLLGCAQRLAGHEPEAAATLKQCATRVMPDIETAHLLVTELEAVGRFEQALVVLERTIEEQGQTDNRLLFRLVDRLWGRGNTRAVLAHLAAIQPNHTLDGHHHPEPTTQLLGMKAMALMRSGHGREAAPLLDALRVCSEHDGVAAAWSIYLGGVFNQPLDPETHLLRCRRALVHDQSNAYIQFALGKALAARGEHGAAITAWQRAAERSPAWAAPYLRLARGLTELDLGMQAVRAAQAARQRMPDDPRCLAALAQARLLHMSQGGQDSPQALLELVSKIQHDHPHEPTTLPMYISLLAEVGQRENAGEALLSALDQPLPQKTLLGLAEASRTHGLGQTDACYAQYEAVHGRTPSLAYARALDHWRRGRADRTWAELRPPSNINQQPATQREWALVQARFLDRISSPDAASTWRHLLERYPQSLRVQHAALEAQAVQADEAMWRGVIRRLRVLTGEEGLSWRLAEGRRLLEMPHATTEAIVEAARLFGEVRRRAPTLVIPRLRLAQAFRRLGEPAMALMQLRIAAEHAPQHQTVLIELARLHVERGETDEALALLDRVVNNSASTAAQLQDAAEMLVRLRGWDEAAVALTRALDAGGRASQKALMLGLAQEQAAAEDSDSSHTPQDTQHPTGIHP